MIHCNNCGFAVNETMKYALMQNSCPSCGSNLFSNRDSNLISMIQNKIINERFSSHLTEELVYDITLFIFNELKHGLGKELINEALSNRNTGSVEEAENDVEPEDEDLRKEIEKEYEEEIAQLTDSGDVIMEDSDIFSKAERLRRLHQQQALQNPNLGKMVPRTGKKKGGIKVNRVE